MKRLAMKKGFYLFHFGIDEVYEANVVLYIEKCVIDPNKILPKLREHLAMNIDESAKKSLGPVDLDKTIIYSVSFLGDEEW